MLPNVFLLKTMMLRKECRNIFTKSRSGPTALWRNLSKRFAVILDFYLLFVSVTLEAQHGFWFGDFMSLLNAHCLSVSIH